MKNGSHPQGPHYSGVTNLTVDLTVKRKLLEREFLPLVTGKSQRKDIRLRERGKNISTAIMILNFLFHFPRRKYNEKREPRDIRKFSRIRPGLLLLPGKSFNMASRIIIVVNSSSMIARSGFYCSIYGHLNGKSVILG